LSKITLSGNASGTGTFTLASPNSNSDRTVNLPDAGGDMVLTTATQTLTNKTFSGAQGFGTASLAEPTGTAPLYMCRAWVNFNGTGTVAIRASGNVSSITDNGTGSFAINFTTAMPDANYSSAAHSAATLAGLNCVNSSSKTTTKFDIFCVGLSGNVATATDPDQVNVAIFR
jgi:hypothetical protein